MKKEEMTIIDLLLEAIAFVTALIYLGLQIYYGISYEAGVLKISMNVLALLLIFVGLTLLQIYPEKVNGLSKQICTGKIKTYTIHMVRLIKLIFVLCLLFTTICDIMGNEMNAGYSFGVVILIVITTIYYEGKIIKILKNQSKK